jgi:hypothetical protein
MRAAPAVDPLAVAAAVAVELAVGVALAVDEVVAAVALDVADAEGLAPGANRKRHAKNRIAITTTAATITQADRIAVRGGAISAGEPSTCQAIPK